MLILLTSYSCKKASLKSSKLSKLSSKENKKQQNDDNFDSFDILSDYIIRASSKIKNTDKINKDFSKQQVYKVILSLSNSQNALKSMDGLTHTFGNTLSDKSSLNARFSSFMKSKKNNRKEAAKVLEYVIAVERALQCANIIQDTMIDDFSDRTSYLIENGLKELKRFELEENKVKVIVSILQPIQIIDEALRESYSNISSSKSLLRKWQSKPRKYENNEYLIVISDAITDQAIAIPKILRIMSKKSVMIPLMTSGFVSEDVMIQESLFKLAIRVIQNIKEFVLPNLMTNDLIDASNASTVNSSSNSMGLDQQLKTKNKKSTTKLKSSLKLKKNSKSSREYSLQLSSEHDKTNAKNITKNSVNTSLSQAGLVIPSKLRILGYSGGGSVASLTTMLLEGSLNVDIQKLDTLLSKSSKTEEKLSNILMNGDMNTSMIGLYSGKVKCVSLASPPCVSRYTLQCKLSFNVKSFQFLYY